MSRFALLYGKTVAERCFYHAAHFKAKIKLNYKKISIEKAQKFTTV